MIVTKRLYAVIKCQIKLQVRQTFEHLQHAHISGPSPLGTMTLKSLLY